jgi:hypothetical protein
MHWKCIERFLLITVFIQLRFGTFAGNGLPVTKVLRQLNFYEVGMSAHSYPPNWKTGTTLKPCRTWLVSLATRLPPAWLSCLLEEDFLEGSNFRTHRPNMILVLMNM